MRSASATRPRKPLRTGCSLLSLIECDIKGTRAEDGTGTFSQFPLEQIGTNQDSYSLVRVKWTLTLCFGHPDCDHWP